LWEILQRVAGTKTVYTLVIHDTCNFKAHQLELCTKYYMKKLSYKELEEQASILRKAKCQAIRQVYWSVRRFQQRCINWRVILASDGMTGFLFSMIC
jgi:predicted DNA-binding protein YlxM (UPF0122 family)